MVADSTGVARDSQRLPDLTAMMTALTAMGIVAEIRPTIRGTGEFPLSTKLA